MNEALKIKSRVEHLLLTGDGMDLGCGPHKIIENCTGVDCEDYGSNIVSSVLSTLSTLPSESKDWIFSSHYLEHEPSHIAVLQECRRILKPQGTLILYLPHRQVYLSAARVDPNPYHLHHWTTEEFVDLLSSFGGFKITVSETRNTTPEGHVFTGDGNTEHPGTAVWEYSFLIIAEKI